MEERFEHEALLKIVDWTRLGKGWDLGRRQKGTKDPLTLR